MKFAYLASRHPSVHDPSQVPEEFDDPLHHTALAFQFYTSTYSQWLDLQDDFDKHKEVIEARYGEISLLPMPSFSTVSLARKNERLKTELDNITKQLADSQLEYEKLKSSAVRLLEFLPILLIASLRHLSRNWKRRMVFSWPTAKNSKKFFINTKAAQRS